MKILLSFFLMLLPFLLMAAVIYRPIHRLKNRLLPTYLYDPKTGVYFTLVAYHGYDKHSAVVATVRECGKDYDRYISDEYYRLVRVARLCVRREGDEKVKLRLIKGGLR
jgi:hypothetical protein